MNKPKESVVYAVREMDVFLYDQIEEHAKIFMANPTSENLKRYILAMEADKYTDKFLCNWDKEHDAHDDIHESYPRSVVATK